MVPVPPGDGLARGFPGSIGRDVHSIGAVPAVAEAARAVLGEVDHHIVAVGRGTDPQPIELLGPDHVDHRHCRLNRDSLCQRSFLRGGM